MDIIKTQYHFYCKTIKSNIIKTLIEALKDILSDINFKLTKTGINFITLDQARCCLVQMKLVSKKFELYYCSDLRVIGLNIKNLYYILKTVGNNDVITLSIPKNDTTKLHVVIENKEKNMRDISKLRLLEIDEHVLKVPDITFDTVVKIPCNDFQKICKDLSNISDKIFIESINDSFIMKVNGDIGEKEIIMKNNNNSYIDINRINDINISEQYPLKYLLSIIKSSNLCGYLDIFLSSKCALVLVYSVGDLGSLKFVLLPYSKTE